jgi:hypothetical protein
MILTSVSELCSAKIYYLAVLIMGVWGMLPNKSSKENWPIKKGWHWTNSCTAKEESLTQREMSTRKRTKGSKHKSLISPSFHFNFVKDPGTYSDDGYPFTSCTCVRKIYVCTNLFLEV